MSNRPRRPKLNLLLSFEVAGRHLSFKDAAKELCVTPSAVSQQVKQLEAHLGLALFKRKNRGLAFTSTGKQYWQQIQTSLNAINCATDTLMREQAKELKVSLMPPVANRVVLPNLNAFHQQYPYINLRLDSSQKIRDVMKGEVDVAVRFGLMPEQEESVVKLCDVRIQLVCPPGFSAQYELKHKPSSITKAPLIHMSQSPEAWTEWFKQTAFSEPKGKQHVLDNYPSAIQAAETLGAMLALMPLEKSLIDSGRLEAPFPASEPIDKVIYAIFNPGSHKLESIKAFIKWLKAEFELLN